MDLQNQEEKKQKSSLFSDATLDPITQRYIHSKYKLAEGEQNFGNIDLRNMCENVVDELETLESAAAYDYLKVENEMKDLDSEIDKSDSILSELEKVLENFRDHLNEIKSQMTVLQDKSLKMNISLTNRKNLQKLMNTFMDSAVLDPKLIDSINSAPIDQQYVQHIKTLCQKLEYLQNTKLPDATVVRELEPELNKLKNKACGRVREFLLEKISILKKPMTNVENQQKHVLLDYRVFTEFLKCHYEEIYTELCNNYAQVMSTVYSVVLDKNVKELKKLGVELYNKSDTLVCENAQAMRTQISLKSGGVLANVHPDKNKSIFDLMERDLILKNDQLNGDPIFYATAQKQNQRFPIEQIFRCLSKIILNMIVSEITFSSQFFNLTQIQNSRIFKQIFTASFKIFYSFLETMLYDSYDCNGMILIILINEAYQREYAEIYTQSQVLQEYFNQINMIVWPRFEKAFEGHRLSISEKNMKQFKLLEKQFTYKPIVQRYSDIIISFYKLYSYFEDNKMLNIRIQLLRKDFINLIKKNALDIGRGLDRCKYLLLIYDQIITNLPTKKELQDEFNALETETTHSISEFINIYLKDLFGEMIDFINQYINPFIKKENADKNTHEEIQESNQGNFKQPPNPADNERLVKTICADFNSSRIKRLEAFKNECVKIFDGTQVLKKILKRFLNSFISYYGTFYLYCQKNHQQAAATLINTHEIMRDIKASYGTE